MLPSARLVTALKSLPAAAAVLCLAMLAGFAPLGSAQESPARPQAPSGAASPAGQTSPANPAGPTRPTGAGSSRPTGSPPEDENKSLREAVTSAAGNPQTLIRNLEQFLTRFPESPQRQAVLSTIYKEALQANDPATAVTYGEKLLDSALSETEEINVLSTIVDLLDRQGDASTRSKAIGYATRLVERAEKMSGEAKPSGVSADKWLQTQALVSATAYTLRAKIRAASKENDEALADYVKSYTAYPTSRVAERMGDLEAQKGATDRALDDYAAAFALRETAADSAHLEELRRKLGSAYVAKHGSERGLGDLVLERYDELMRSLRSRFDTRLRLNAEVRDPFASVLLRPDGTEVRFSEFRGKVVVLDFWATWCGPCIMEGYLMERVLLSFRSELAAVFLAVNVDEDRSHVPDFVRNQRWTIPVVYAQGLDNLLEVHALPTLMILDRQGRVVYRQEGASTDTKAFEQRVREALDHPVTASATVP